MTNSKKKCLGVLGSAFAVFLFLQLGATRNAKACSGIFLLDYDWEISHSNVVDNEMDVPTNLVLRMELFRWSRNHSYIDYERGVDPNKFKLVCNEETVDGAFHLSDDGPIFMRSEIQKKDGKWSLEHGCWLPCEAGRVFLQLEFVPKNDLPAGASCELVLSQFCTSHGCTDTGTHHDYPRTLVSFETGDAETSDSLDLGEPLVEAFVYKDTLSTCKWIGPDSGSCSSCVEVSTHNGWGAVFSYAGISERTHELLVDVFIADSVAGLAHAEWKTFLLNRRILEDKAGVTLPLGGKNDAPRCIQAIVHDRSGRVTTRSAAVCTDPAELSWPSESSGCSMGGRGGFWVSLLGLMLLFALIRLRHGKNI